MRTRSPLQIRMDERKRETEALVRQNEDEVLWLATQPGATEQIREVARQITDRRTSPGR